MKITITFNGATIVLEDDKPTSKAEVKVNGELIAPMSAAEQIAKGIGECIRPTGESEKKIGKKYTCGQCGDYFYRAGKGKPKYCPTCKANRLRLPKKGREERPDESIFGDEAEIDREKI